MLIVGLPWYGLLSVVGNVLIARGQWNDQTERWFQAIWYVPWLLYSLQEIVWASTPGKKLLNMQITCSDGSPADRWALVMRYIGKQYPWVFAVIAGITQNAFFSYLGGLGAVIVLIGCLYAMNDDKRAWHDDWAGTAVELRRPRAAGFPIESR